MGRAGPPSVVTALTARARLAAADGSRATIGRAALLLGGLVLGVIATVAPATAVMLLFAAIFLFAAFKNLAAGLALFTVLTFFLSIPGTPSGGVSMIKIAGGVLALSWLLTIAAQRDRARLLVRDHVWISYAAVFFIVWALCSAAWAEDPGGAVSAALRLSQGVVLVFIVYTALRGPREIRWIVWAFLGGALLTALIGLGGSTSAESFSPYADTGRLAGQIGDPNELAALLVPALVFSTFMLAAVKNPLLRLFLATSVGVFMVALFLTQSRGGLVALGATFLVTPFLAGPVRARAVAVMLVVVAAGVSYYVLVAPPEAIERITHFSAGGGTGRTDLWGIALDMTGNHPVGGVGAGNFQTIEPRYALGNVNLESIDLIVDTPKVAHNTYLHILAELGIVGFLAFVAVLGGAVFAGWRAARRLEAAGEREDGILARGIVIGTVGMLAAFAFISSQYGKQLWLLIGLVIALDALARRSAPEPAPSAAPWRRWRRREPRTASQYDRAVGEGLAGHGRGEPRRSGRLDPVRADLERRHRELLRQERELQLRAKELDELEKRREGLAAGVARATAALRRRERDIAEREAAVAGVESHLLERGTPAAAESTESPERVRALEASLAAARRRADEAEARLVELGADAARTAARDVGRHAETLDAREGELARREAELRRIEDDLLRRTETAADVERYGASLAERDLVLDEHETALRDWERALAEQEAGLKAREAERQAILSEAAAAPLVAPAPPAGEVVQLEPGRWILGTLERLVDRHGGEHPDRLEEWRYYLVYLREFVGADEVLPAEFDALVREVFGDLVRRGGGRA